MGVPASPCVGVPAPACVRGRVRRPLRSYLLFDFLFDCENVACFSLCFQDFFPALQLLLFENLDTISELLDLLADMPDFFVGLPKSFSEVWVVDLGFIW